ncbi:MAG TPA: tetratricopeptide repeat protein [Phycisphaerales bacterium]|nr:tetratricopeptide repeat protein [Phycisphaerales bacterium]
MAKSRAQRKRIILAATVFAVVGLAAGAYGVRQAQIRRNMDRWLVEGTAAHERGDYAAALDNLNQYISRDKTNARALLDFADSRKRIPVPGNAHLEQAIRVVQTALALEPDSLEGHLMLMQLYIDAGYVTEAKDAAERVIELDSTNIQAHRTRIAALNDTGQDAALVDAAMRMADALPDDLSAQREVLAYLMAGGADVERTEAFVVDCADRFEPQLGLELMRAMVALHRLSRSEPNSEAYGAQLARAEEHLRTAATMEVRSGQEAVALVEMLDDMGGRLPGLADQTMARLMQDPRFAEPLATLAAERAWTSGENARAGRVLVESIPDLSKADDEAIGWLAMTPVPEAADARRILAERATPEARNWSILADAYGHLDADRPLEAAGALNTLTVTDQVNARAMAAYLRGVVDAALGETARAAARWEELLAAEGGWAVVRRRLVQAYISLERLDDAERVLSGGKLPGLDPLELATRLAERDPTPERTKRAVTLAEMALKTAPDMLSVRAWSARAFAVAEDAERSRALVDGIIAEDALGNSLPILELATALEPRMPELAAALHSRLSRESDQPVVAYRLAIGEAAAGRLAEGRALLEQRVAAAAPDEQHTWKLLLARYLDDIGSPEAAPMFLGLSAAKPADLTTQQNVLNSSSVWLDPAPLEPVIGRLAQITGRQGLQWQIYQAKRDLLLIEPGAKDAEQRASGIVLSLSRVLREDPDNVAALDLCADASGLLKDHERRADFLGRAVRMRPAEPERRMELIDALTVAGRVEEAKQHARALAEVRIDSPQLAHDRARVLERFGFSELAQRDWIRLGEAGEPSAKLRLALRLLREGKAGEADALVREVSELPTLPESVIIDLAAYCSVSGRVEEGIAVLKRLPEEGKFGNRDEVIAKYLFINDGSAETAAELERMAGETRRGAIWALAALEYQSMGRLEDTSRLLEQGLAAQPESPELLAVRRMREAEASQDKSAFLAFLRAVLIADTTPEAAAVGVLIDRHLAGRASVGELIDGLTRIKAEAPLSEQAWLGLAASQYVAGEPNAMRSTLLDALDALPANVNAARLALQLFLNASMPEDALVAARALRERLPVADFGVDLTIAQLLTQLGRAQQALPVLEPWRSRIAAAGAERPRDVVALGAALAASGNVDAADELLSQLVTTHPQGAALYTAASEHVRDPALRRAWLERGTPLALEDGELPVLLDLVNSWWDFAATTRADGDIRRVAEVAEEAIKRGGGDRIEFRMAAATAYDALKEPASALPHYRVLVELAPDAPMWHNNLAYALLAAKQSAADALAHANRAVELEQAAGKESPALRSYLDTQAQALLANGQPDEAAAIYRSALASDNRWVVGLLGLCEALAASGQTEEARVQLSTLESMELSDDLSSRTNAVRQSLGRN